MSDETQPAGMLAPTVQAGAMQTEEWAATRPVLATEPPATEPTPYERATEAVLFVDGLI
jgi:hypothetical protein